MHFIPLLALFYLSISPVIIQCPLFSSEFYLTKGSCAFSRLTLSSTDAYYFNNLRSLFKRTIHPPCGFCLINIWCCRKKREKWWHPRLVKIGLAFLQHVSPLMISDICSWAVELYSCACWASGIFCVVFFCFLVGRPAPPPLSMVSSFLLSDQVDGPSSYQ